jgi:hypothetical protein
VSDSGSGALYQFDLATRKLAKLPGSEEMHYAVGSPDGRYIASASENKLAVFDFRQFSEYTFPAARKRRWRMHRTFIAPGGFGTWFGLTPDDSPLFLRNISSQQIYAIDWEAPLGSPLTTSNSEPQLKLQVTAGRRCRTIM